MLHSQPALLKGNRAIARHTGLSLRDVKQLVDAGLLPGFKIGARHVVDTDALRAWLDRKMLRDLLTK